MNDEAIKRGFLKKAQEYLDKKLLLLDKFAEIKRKFFGLMKESPGDVFMRYRKNNLPELRNMFAAHFYESKHPKAKHQFVTNEDYQYMKPVMDRFNK